MASAAQIEANRKNAQKSTGPVTPEGKAKSGRNSIRHGILSRIIPIDAPGYRELLVGLYTSLKPQDELQRMMVDQIAITTMRLRRIWAAEQSYLYTKSRDWPDGPDSNSSTVHSYLEVPTAVTYLRYESMLNRLLARLLRQYHAIRSDQSWAKISQSNSPYVQEEAAEQLADAAQTEQQVAGCETVPSRSSRNQQVPQNWGVGGRKRAAEDSPAAPVEERTIQSDAPFEDEEETLSTICPDLDAKLAELASIPYNEYAVQSRVAAYDARQKLYGWP